MKKQSLLTHERLTEVLSYDRATGIFRWRVAISNRVRVGAVAGTINDGARIIRIDKVDHFAHRLAWFYVTGQWPKNSVDHRDLNPDHNAFDNLREATQAQNVCNCKVRKHNRSGLKGAHWHKGAQRWMSQIAVGRKCHYLGLFDTPEEAAAAYAAASLKYHGEFGRIS